MILQKIGKSFQTFSSQRFDKKNYKNLFKNILIN